MAKQTDITGTFRVPEEAWGKFWNLMRTIDGADIVPNTRVESAGKKARANGKASEGSTGKCIALNYLNALSPDYGTTAQITQALVEGGKSPKSSGNVLHELLKNKQVKKGSKGYAITAAGGHYLATKCKG
jgi:hypothetical protein